MANWCENYVIFHLDSKEQMEDIKQKLIGPKDAPFRVSKLFSERQLELEEYQHLKELERMTDEDDTVAFSFQAIAPIPAETTDTDVHPNDIRTNHWSVKWPTNHASLEEVEDKDGWKLIYHFYTAWDAPKKVFELLPSVTGTDNIECLSFEPLSEYGEDFTFQDGVIQSTQYHGEDLWDFGLNMFDHFPEEWEEEED